MIPVILSGGGGTRLWPVSTRSVPKQFADLLDESLFVKTLLRLKPLGTPWVVTTEDMQGMTEQALHDVGIFHAMIVLEPQRKNTAPAVALICKQLELSNRQHEVVGIFPSDHVFSDSVAFMEAIKIAEGFALDGNVATLGIKPSFPATGFGYIETKTILSRAGHSAHRAVSFREKPDIKTAIRFLTQQNFFWNAGIFVFRVDTMVELFKTYAPEIWSGMSLLESDLGNISEIYTKLPPISLDYAVMEHIPEHICVPYDKDWNDLGSWDSMMQVIAEEQVGINKFHIESANVRVFTKKEKTYAFVGVNDLIVVDTEDALLIVQAGRSELVKELVEKMAYDRKIL